MEGQKTPLDASISRFFSCKLLSKPKFLNLTFSRPSNEIPAPFFRTNAQFYALRAVEGQKMPLDASIGWSFHILQLKIAKVSRFDIFQAFERDSGFWALKLPSLSSIQSPFSPLTHTSSRRINFFSLRNKQQARRSKKSERNRKKNWKLNYLCIQSNRECNY